MNTAPPTISGTPNVGETLSCSSGSWDNNPTSYSYEWDQDGIPLGAFSETYAVEGPSANHSLTCTVTAFNAAGSASATSSVVEVSAAPVNTAPPTISGTPNEGTPAVDTALSETLALGPTALSVACSGQDIILVSVQRRGQFVDLSGVALPKYAGKSVGITLTDVPANIAQSKGGTASVAADGTFQATLPAPTGPGVRLARYTATVAGHPSLALKLDRALKVVAQTPVKGGLQVSFKLTRSPSTTHTIKITREFGCLGTAVYAAAKLSSRGTVTVLLPASAAANTLSYYRAAVDLQGARTYSVLIAVAGA